MWRDDDSGFLDLVYGTTIEPALWVPVLERFADMVGGSSACLTRFDVATGAGSAILARSDPSILAAYHQHFAAINPLNNVANASAFLRDWQPRILTDEDWIAKDVYTHTEYYNDFMRPLDRHSILWARLALRENSPCVINVHRPAAPGPFSAADRAVAAAAHPHLIRAFELGQKLHMDRALDHGAAAMFDRSAQALFLLDRDCRVLRTNRVAEALLAEEPGFSVRNRRLTMATSGPARSLEALIAVAASADPKLRTGGALAAPCATRAYPMLVTVAPLRAEDVAVFHREPCVLVCITDVEAGVSLPEARLREMFGFTPAEARLALTLLEGHALREAAVRLGVSANTAAVHLARLFQKTGVNRQGALVALLTRAAVFRLDDD
jgi:DNA-binding CsgD family transcriptional regulator